MVGFEPAFAGDDECREASKVTLVYLQRMRSDIDPDQMARERLHSSPSNLSQWEGNFPTFYKAEDRYRIWIRAEDIFQQCLQVHNHVIPRNGLLKKFFELDVSWAAKMKRLGGVQEQENKKTELRNYYYWVNLAVNDILWKHADAAVARGKRLCKEEKTDWDPESEGIHFPNRPHKPQSSTLEKAKRQLKGKLRRCKAKAPISGNGGYVLPTLEDELEDFDKDKLERARDKQYEDELKTEDVGGIEDYWSDSDEEMDGNKRNKSAPIQEMETRSLQRVYTFLREVVQELKNQRKFCGRLPRCVEHRRDLCRICTPRGRNMTYRWVCAEETPDVFYVFGAWQGYFPKIFHDNSLPVGSFLCGQSINSRYS